MLFNSYEFLFLFLPLSLLGFFLLGHQHRQLAAIIWLAMVSLFFYAWWSPVYLGLLLASIVFNYLLGRRLGRSAVQVPTDRPTLIFGIVSNLLLLGYYKYAGFFVSNINLLNGTQWSLGEIILPLGISFFTFTQIAYLVDAYRKEVREYHFGHYLLFVTFFPHLIAGPVLHHAEIMPQFRKQETFQINAENFAVGFSIFFIGLFKKVMIADTLAGYATPVFAAAQAGEPLSGLAAWGGALAYAFQIYFDFSGYSDMAIGLARMFGIIFPANFNSPYKARNIIEFWRCWHMTLSRFLRDYLYFPLGGNRCAPWRRQINLMITMLLGGLWHGAGWTFVIWGALHGSYLVINHLWKKLLGDRLQDMPAGVLKLGRIISVFLTFLCVVIAWVFFRAESLPAALAVLEGMAGHHGFQGDGEYFRGRSEVGFLLLSAILVWAAPNIQEIMQKFSPALETYDQHRPAPKMLIWSPSGRWALIIGLLGAIAVINMTGISEFLYFQF